MDYSYPLLCSCERNRDRVALIGPDGPVTYGDLEAGIAGLAAGLSSLRVGGKAVASIMPNGPRTVELYMALARSGAVGVPLNTRLNEAEKAFMLEDAGVTTLVAEAEFLDEALRLAERVDSIEGVISDQAGPGVQAGLEELRRTEPGLHPVDADGDDGAPATIIYTSGTTGRPKGVVRTHRANSWNAVNSALGSPRAPSDVEVFNLPLFGIGFLHFVVPALLGGATVVLDRSFDPARAWQQLEGHEATRTFLAPTMIDSMLAVPDQESRDVSSLEVIYTAYTFPERLRDLALERFGARFVYMYGLTEAQLTTGAREQFEAKPTSVGRTMGASRVAVFSPEGERLPDGEVGEIGFEGPSVMSGYHNLPEATAESSAGAWVLTGDLGRFDEEHDLHYVGRSKEMIKTGGFSVDPVEVENAILTLSEVREAAVIGVADDHWGESVVAFVSLDPGSPLEAGEIIAACKRQITGYKVPKRILITDELPKNPTGKVERGKLRKIYEEESHE